MTILLSAIQSGVSSALIFIGFILLLALFIFFIVRLQKRYKKDKMLYIDDFVDMKALTKLMDFRINNQNKKNKTYFSLMVISIDNLEQIGEYISQRGKEDYLKKFIASIRMTLPKGAKIAKCENKSNYVVYLPEYYDEEAFFEIAQSFKNSAERRIKLANKIPIQKNVSVALTCYPEQGDTSAKLLNNLFMTLYSIKKNGGNEIVFYNSEFDREGAFVEHYKELDKAVVENEFNMKFNVLYNTSKKRFCGAQSILEWKKAEDVADPYENFSSYLEESEDDFWFAIWALEKAIISNIGVLRLSNIKDYFITMFAGLNVLENEETANILQSALDKYELSPRSVVFEVNQLSGQENNSKLIKSMSLLKGVGFKFLVEAERYQNLEEIVKTFDIDFIKIDIEKIDSEQTQNIYAIAEKYCLKLICSGVENEEQFENVKGKVDFVEGGLYGTNMKGQDLLELTEKE